MNEETIYLYHMGIDWLAKASLLSIEQLDALRERLKVEAALSRDKDSVALRVLANALEPYLQD